LLANQQLRFLECVARRSQNNVRILEKRAPNNAACAHFESEEDKDDAVRLVGSARKATQPRFHRNVFNACDAAKRVRRDEAAAHPPSTSPNYPSYLKTLI